jgi:hypothetical protein
VKWLSDGNQILNRSAGPSTSSPTSPTWQAFVSFEQTAQVYAVAISTTFGRVRAR